MKPSNPYEFALAIGVIACFSFAGTLARLGCDWILKSTVSVLAPNTSPLGTDFLANIVGCFVIGALDRFNSLKQSTHALLYIAAVSGFCGSLTTFSGWQVQTAQTFLRPDIFVAFLNLLVGFGSFYCCFRSGRHFGCLIQRIYSHCYAHKPATELDLISSPPAVLPTPAWMIAENVVVACLGYALWVLFGLLFIFVSRGRLWTGAAFFAPVGALIRWYSSFWNANWPNFKLATFSVNVGGVTFYSVLLICNLKYGSSPPYHILSAILEALLSGFCGALTTVSTFIMEAHYAPRIHRAYFYVLASFVSAQSVALCILAVSKFAFKISSI